MFFILRSNWGENVTLQCQKFLELTDLRGFQQLQLWSYYSPFENTLSFPSLSAINVISALENS